MSYGGCLLTSVLGTYLVFMGSLWKAFDLNPTVGSALEVVLRVGSFPFFGSMPKECGVYASSIWQPFWVGNFIFFLRSDP